MTRNTATAAPAPAEVDRLRVLFVNTRDGLGADVAVHALLARHLGAEGVTVAFTINSQATGAGQMRQALNGARNVRLLSAPLGCPGSRRKGPSQLLTLVANCAALWGVFKLAILILRLRIDVLHATDRPRDALICTFLGRITRRPSIIHLHNAYGPWMGSLCRQGFRSSSLVIGVSEFTSRTLQEVRLPAERIATVLNAVDSDYFDPRGIQRGQVRERWDIPLDAPLVGIVGRLIPWKGHDDLLDALAGDLRLGRTHLLIVGDTTGSAGAYVEHLRARANALGILPRVHFAGLQDVRPIYADIDVLAVPTWEEPFGLVVTEAMAMRVPVVAYRAGGIPEIIRPGVDGFLVTPRAIPELAAALAQLLEDPALRARIGAAGRERVKERFSPSRQGSEIAALYRQVRQQTRRAKWCQLL